MFRRLAAHAPVGLFLTDEKGWVTYVNDRWVAMSGRGPEAAAGMAWLGLLHPEDKQRVHQLWSGSIQTRADFRAEFRFNRPPGDEIWVEAQATWIDDLSNDCPGYVGSCSDVTERKQTEARMRLYETFFSDTPDYAYVSGRNHRILYANQSLLNLWGRDWESTIGKSWEELGYSPSYAERHAREIEKVIETKQSLRTEIPLVCAQGRWRIYEFIFTPVLAENGDVEAVAGTSRDVTERKRVEERAILLSELTGTLARLSTEQEIVSATVEAVGMHLDCQRCHLVECLNSENLVRIGKNWTRDGGPEMSGDFKLSDFGGAKWWANYSGGDLIVEDVRTHWMTRHMADTYLATGVQSFAVQPFKQEGEWSVVLVVTEAIPRTWAREEMELLENVISRAWPLVERARALERMRRSQERLALVADQIPAMVALIGRDHRFLYGNERCREWLDFPDGKITGTHLDELAGEAGKHFYLQDGVERVLAGETVKFEVKLRHKDLGLRDVELTYMPDRGAGGRTRGFFVMGTDITARNQAAEAARRQSEGRLLLGEVGRVIIDAETADEMLSGMCGTVMEHLQADICLVLRPASAGGGVEFRRGLSKDIPEEELEDNLKREGARAFAIQKLRAGDEPLGSLVFASRSVEEFGADDLEFMETVAQYVTAARVRLRLLGTLRESDQRKDHFLATLAHELRNPLAPIVTGLGIMKRGQIDPELLQRIIGIIERQTGQMVHLIDELLDISRVNTGKIVLKKSATPLAAIVRNAMEASLPLFQERGHTLETDLPPDTTGVVVDPSRVAQVISNLLSNAAKYTPTGGLIRLEAGANGEDAWIRVRDNGLGIDPAEHQSIFDLFHQSAHGSPDGLGIGLTLVKSIVELHGGSVSVRSEGRSNGAEFLVRLPGCVVPGAEPKPEVIRRSPTGKGRVLVVDDGKNAADMLALYFRMEGMDVEVAYDGCEGLEKARKIDPDLVIMDLGMPRMDGLEAARHMRSENLRAKLIALSGWGRDEDKQRTVEAGFDDHVVKPVSPEDLQEIMRKYFAVRD